MLGIFVVEIANGIYKASMHWLDLHYWVNKIKALLNYIVGTKSIVNLFINGQKTCAQYT